MPARWRESPPRAGGCNAVRSAASPSLNLKLNGSRIESEHDQSLQEPLPEIPGRIELHALERGRVSLRGSRAERRRGGPEARECAPGAPLEILQRPRQRDLIPGQVGPEGVLAEVALPAVAPQGQLQTPGEIVAECLRDAVVGADLARRPGARQQLLLKARVGHVQECCDRLLVGAPANVRDAVLGDDDIAQVSRNGGVPVAPQEVRGGAATPGARGAHAQYRARIGERVRHGDEVVLSADARYNLARLELVGDCG